MSHTTEKFDLTQGPILQRLLFVALPIMGTQLMQMAYNLTDMFWLGKVGSDAVAASATAGMYLWLSMAFMFIGRMGAEIGVSQSLGLQDRNKAETYAQNALLLSIILGILFAAVMIIANKPLIGFFRIKEANVAADAAKYLVITGFATPFPFITAAIGGTFNGSGNSRTPFYINATGLIINMLLDPLFIFHFQLNVTGAALATSIAQIIVAVLFIVAIKKDKNRPFASFKIFKRFNPEIVRQIIQWSLPISMESLFFTLLSMIISRFVAGWGAPAIAVQKVGSQIESLAWLVGGGFSSAVTAFIGQNFGAGKWRRIHQGFKISMTAMFIWGVFVTVILYFGGNFFMALFLKETELIRIGATYMKYLAICQIPSCLEYNSSGAFKGIGKTLPPSIASIGGNAIRIPLIYYLSQTSLGLEGIWLGISLGAMIRSTWLVAWFFITTRKLPKNDQIPLS